MYDVTNNTGTNVGPLVRGRVVSQRFTPRAGGLVGVSLSVATYHKQIPSELTFELCDAETGDVLRTARADTAGFADNSWQRIAFDPVGDSAGRPFVFRVSTDAEGDAVTLWTNARLSDACRENDRPADFGAICHRTHYLRSSHALLDPILGAHVARCPEPDVVRRELLHEIVRYCVCRKEYFFLRLVHLLDAFARTTDVHRVLSIGCGMGYHEAFLAARFPDLSVRATDLRLFEDEFRLPNLAFHETDILAHPEAGDFDFVFSIECLEHIHDYEAAFRNMAAKVRPGGWFYLSVPFATLEEQRDPSLIALAWEHHEHVLPGFDFATLERSFDAAGFDVVFASNMFTCAIAHPLNGLLHVIDTPTIETVLDDVVRLFLLDLAPSHVDSHRVAEGVKVLGRRRSGADA